MTTDFAEYNGSLGTNCTEKGTVFRVWQPQAERVELRLYNDDGELTKRAAMRNKGGVFECRVRGDLDGVKYDFAVTRGGETVACGDPYAKSVTADGRLCVLVNMRRHAPKGWLSDRPIRFPDPEDAVICELLVRDFSMDESASFKARGKLAALCETRVTNSRGDTDVAKPATKAQTGCLRPKAGGDTDVAKPATKAQTGCLRPKAGGDKIGLSYIKKLGVTHIQLMPVFDFDLDGGEYNWGYNPRFYNAVSAYYTQNDGVFELRAAVAAAHKKGLGVVADVVYNHVFDAGSSAFERLFPGYFFRVDEETGAFSNGSGCGNEFASERVMARKFIVDSLVFLAREYHLDGFRFDLMGLLDIETLREAERQLRAVNPDILLYGEGWTGGISPLSESRRAVQKNARQLPNFAFFNDRFRDALKGSVFSAEDCGYVNGNSDEWHSEAIRAALSGEFSEDFWTRDPRQTLNYAECHDNLTLFDKLKISLGNADLERIKKGNKMAAALIFLSRGMAFLQAGQEFLRTKNGDGNSYKSGDAVNSIKWDMLAENRDVAEYYRGLIAIRKRFRREMNGAEKTFEPVGDGFMMTAGDFILIVNPTAEELTLNLEGTFKVYADGERAGDKPLYTTKRLCCAEFSVLFTRKIK